MTEKTRTAATRLRSHEAALAAGEPAKSPYWQGHGWPSRPPEEVADMATLAAAFLEGEGLAGITVALDKLCEVRNRTDSPAPFIITDMPDALGGGYLCRIYDGEGLPTHDGQGKTISEAIFKAVAASPDEKKVKP